jgi:hypothetical protein
MTTHTAVIPDVEADIRWRDWQARGADSERRTAARMRKVMLLIVAALIVWVVVQLTMMSETTRAVLSA